MQSNVRIEGIFLEIQNHLMSPDYQGQWWGGGMVTRRQKKEDLVRNKIGTRLWRILRAEKFHCVLEIMRSHWVVLWVFIRKEAGDLREDDVIISVWQIRKLRLLSDKTELESELKSDGLLAVVLGGRTEREGQRSYGKDATIVYGNGGGSCGEDQRKAMLRCLIRRVLTQIWKAY